MSLRGWPDSGPPRQIRPITRPGASRALAAVLQPGITAEHWRVQLGGTLGFFAVFAAGIVIATKFGPIAAIAAILGLPVVLLAGGIMLFRWVRGHVVFGPDWRFEGVAIRGAALDMLEDIDGRFAYAERHIRELPTGIVWADVEDDVGVLLWEAAEHAARVAALDVEIHEMRYAANGSPQAAYRRFLQERRQEHWQLLLDDQREADELARVAGNAVAAAKVALARAGGVHGLEVVTPSPKAISARWSLAEARARLTLLAEVWTELDESAAIQSERLENDADTP